MAADALELLDALGLARVVVQGVSGERREHACVRLGRRPTLSSGERSSVQNPPPRALATPSAPGGAPFACAVAALLPKRVAALLLVCPLAQTAGREARLLAGHAETSLRLHHRIKHQPWRLWASLHLLRLIQARPGRPACKPPRCSSPLRAALRCEVGTHRSRAAQVPSPARPAATALPCPQRVPHGNLLLRVGGFAEADIRAMHAAPAAAAQLAAGVREGLRQGVAGAMRDLQARSPCCVRCGVSWTGVLESCAGMAVALAEAPAPAWALTPPAC